MMINFFNNTLIFFIKGWIENNWKFTKKGKKKRRRIKTVFEKKQKTKNLD
jgi:hypothetical protein